MAYPNCDDAWEEGGWWAERWGGWEEGGAKPPIAILLHSLKYSLTRSRHMRRSYTQHGTESSSLIFAFMFHTCLPFCAELLMMCKIKCVGVAVCVVAKPKPTDFSVKQVSMWTSYIYRNGHFISTYEQSRQQRIITSFFRGRHDRELKVEIQPRKYMWLLSMRVRYSLIKTCDLMCFWIYVYFVIMSQRIFMNNPLCLDDYK